MPPSRALIAAALLAAMTLPACRSSSPPPATVAAPEATAHAAAERFRVDAGNSTIWRYLRAAGPLARVGHSHVITTQALRGTVWLAPQLSRSDCTFEFAASALVVDDPGERARAGGEFALPLDAEARAGTREHMLGAGQLDAMHAPLLRLRCRAVSATADGAVLDLTVTVHGVEAPLRVPVRWRRTARTLEADGEFDFRQTDLGIEPYSVGFGALRVADEIHARFHVRAQRT